MRNVLFVAFLSVASFAAEPASSPLPKRRSLDTVMVAEPDVDVTTSFGPNGEARCSTRPTEKCGACAITCPAGKAAVCAMGHVDLSVAARGGDACTSPPVCVCK